METIIIMVKVKYNPLSQKSGKGIDFLLLRNMTMKQLAKTLRQNWSKTKCEAHLSQLSTVIISMDENDKINFRCSFCCEEFSKQFELKQ
jgi:hypothetical protein